MLSILLFIALTLKLLKFILIKFAFTTKIYNKLADWIYFNALVRFILEGYLELCIDSFLNIKNVNNVFKDLDKIQFNNINHFIHFCNFHCHICSSSTTNANYNSNERLTQSKLRNLDQNINII